MARILVADDARDVRDLIEAVLARDGHEVVIAAEPFDVICSDLDMPGLNGVELTRAIRAGAAGEVPILLVSGSGSPQDIREAHEAGISSFLEKPFTVSRLRDQVRAHVETLPSTGCAATSDGSGARPSVSGFES